jgi:hypothetical protein
MISRPSRIKLERNRNRVTQPCSKPSLEDGFQFLLTGEFGARYQIEKNDDWQGWSPLGTVTNLFGTTQFNDASATNSTRRVYRAVQALP